MTPAIAIVGMACRYPDAATPADLWDNVLSQRRAFRRLPSERLDLDDYWSADRNTADTTYSTEAAVLEGYEFDRERFRIAGSTFRAADMAHWLALEVAADALVDAGFTAGQGLPREATGVLVGNSLTGEFSRANVMRLRWPYVRRVLLETLTAEGWSDARSTGLLAELEQRYKAPFPELGDESLAGGLSNTIAGRICNHFDLGGGGYSVDGACASSLLAISNACSALLAQDLDVALAGGVDLSLDPFELVGFAKVGALAEDMMRVFDARAAGFWPGEGCGMVVLMRLPDALAQCRRIYAVVRGWGVSSDGHGGITRPEVAGQQLALRRAYRRAGFDIGEVGYFEGHGTGTVVGDATELRALSLARQQAAGRAVPAVIGSIKANIGHTKAAAGVAGLIKAAMSVHAQILPPSCGCETEHPELVAAGTSLRVLRQGSIWPVEVPLRAGISAMGFGGINAHVVLEAVDEDRRRRPSTREQSLFNSEQDSELFLLAADDQDALARRVADLLSFAGRLSRSELTDLAAQLVETLETGPCRAAILASSPAELSERLGILAEWLRSSAGGELTRNELLRNDHLVLGRCDRSPRIGFVFPGQGSPPNLGGGRWARRFESIAKLYREFELPRVPTSGTEGTEIAQPAITLASLAGLSLLDALGIEAAVAVGHSLGELSAYHWAGAFDQSALLRIAAGRGQAMAQCSGRGSAMASIAAGETELGPLLTEDSVVLAALNSPQQTVISGPEMGVAAVLRRARAQGLSIARLNVSHAFHSPCVAAAVPRVRELLTSESFAPLAGQVASSVLGTWLSAEADLRELLVRHITSPVRFLEAVRTADQEIDLWIEVGPGQVLQGLLGELTDAPALSLNAGGDSLQGLLRVVGTAFTLGAPVQVRRLLDGRFRRIFPREWRPKFLTNPCSATGRPAPTGTAAERASAGPAGATRQQQSVAVEPRQETAASEDPLDTVRRLAAARAELPLASVGADDRLLSDLHLSSLAVGQLFSEAARALDLPPPVSPTDAANATVGELAAALAELGPAGQAAHGRPAVPAGADAWIRAFATDRVARPLPSNGFRQERGGWEIVAADEHPLARRLASALGEAAVGSGIAVCLPAGGEPVDLSLFVDAARRIARSGPGSKLIVVTDGGIGAAFAKTVRLERPDVCVCAIDLPFDQPDAPHWVVAEAGAVIDFCEVRYNARGQRFQPVLKLVDVPQEAAVPFDRDDVLLVTGGGKGIAAECAFSLAQQTGARLAIVGRSNVQDDAELQHNLARFEGAGLTFSYAQADVTDTAAMQRFVDELTGRWGPVTAVIHAAGINHPQPLSELTLDSLSRTMAPKTDGARNIVAAVDPEQLRMFIAFGSIIARSGLPGQAEYALANEWLTQFVESQRKQHPNCHWMALEWSVWSGAGMGQRLGRVEALRQQGITPISIEAGVDMLQRLLTSEQPSPLVISGRYGDVPTIRFGERELPLLRFLERQLSLVPGVELIVEADLSPATDPYLRDHIYAEVPLLPAVVGLEAMAQAVMGLTGWPDPPRFERVTFDHPVLVSDLTGVTIRLVVLARSADLVEVVLRSSETGFQQDHFRAVCRPQADHDTPAQPAELAAVAGHQRLPLEPERDLYGSLLFHTGRFQRLSGYRELAARHCVAEITPDDNRAWFGPYLPARRVLGDAAARDAVIHAIQACIPQGTLLPVGVERLVPRADLRGPLIVSAREVVQEGDNFVYDVTVANAEGILLERWEGLRLRRVSHTQPTSQWPPALLGPYLERRTGELISAEPISVVVQNGTATRAGRSHAAVAQAVGSDIHLQRRGDGKPELAANGDGGVSISHSDDLTMAVSGQRSIGCDAETVELRELGLWQDLVGAEGQQLARLTQDRSGDDESAAHTRVWSARECLKKMGVTADAPLVIDEVTPDQWVVFRSGEHRVATWTAPPDRHDRRRVFAVSVKDT